MSLEEDIALNQFGQGVQSVAQVLDQFSQLNEEQKRKLFIQLYCEVSAAELVEADVEQALADCSLKTTDPIYSYLKLHRLTTGLKGVVWIPETANPPEGKLDKSYQVLLYLFKTDYQRRFALEKENPTSWRYWDLSNPEIIQSILTTHRELVEQVYNVATFRSEFACLAKRWYEDLYLSQYQAQEPEPEPQIHSTFQTYDEVLNASVFTDQIARSLGLVRQALANALSIRYKLNAEQVNRLIVDVTMRHLQETYHIDPT